MIFIKLICIIALIVGHYITSVTLGTFITIVEHKSKEKDLWPNIWFMSWIIFSVFAILVVIF